MPRVLRAVLTALVLTASLAWAVSKTSTSREEQSLYNPILTAASGCTNAVLASALTAIGTTPTTLLLSPIDGAGAACSWTISSNQTIPRTVTLQVPRGATLSVNSGITLTIAGPLQADDPDWYSGAGTVTFAYTSLGSEERFSTHLAGYVISGCLPATSATTTTAAFACESVSKDGRQSTQAAAAVTFSGGDGTYWLAAHKDTTSAVTSWTRESGTHYLWRIASSQPTTPAGAVLLAKVTVSGAAVTAVYPLGGRNGPLPLSVVHGAYSVREFGILGDGTDVTLALRQAIATVPAGGGTLVFPIGTYVVSSTLSLKDLRNLTLECVTIARRVSDSQACTIQYTGASGSLFAFEGALGVTIRGFNLAYTDVSYTDIFLDLDQGTGALNTSEIVFEYNRIGGTSTSSKTASMLVRAAETVYDITFQHNQFLNGVMAIRGSTVSAVNSNIVTIRHNLFTPTFTGGMLQPAGTQWNIENNTFEPRGSSLGNAVFIGTIGVNGLKFTGNWLGDGSNAGTKWFQASGGVISGGLIAGNSFQDVQLTSHCLDFGTLASTGLTIVGNDFHCGVGIVGAGVLTFSHISGNSFSYGGGSTALSTQPTVGPNLVSTDLEQRFLSAATAQSNPTISARMDASNARPNNVEWGHFNTGGYGNNLGATQSSGHGFICLSCEAGTTANTYKTRGKVGRVIENDLSGRMLWGTAATASADNQTLTQQVRLDANGHLEYKGTAPTLSSCGTSPSIVGNDMVGSVTTGTTNGASCTVTFAAEWTNAPLCVLTPRGSTITLTAQSVTTLQFAAARSSGANIPDNDIFDYHCAGRF